MLSVHNIIIKEKIIMSDYQILIHLLVYIIERV